MDDDVEVGQSRERLDSRTLCPEFKRRIGSDEISTPVGFQDRELVRHVILVDAPSIV
jgi:hypothetical protein